MTRHTGYIYNPYIHRIFFPNVTQTSSTWDAILEASDGTSTIDVQNWYVVPGDNNDRLTPISKDESHLVRQSFKYIPLIG